MPGPLWPLVYLIRRRHPLPPGVAWVSSSVGHRTSPLPHRSGPCLGSGLVRRCPWCVDMDLVVIPRRHGPGRHLVVTPRPRACLLQAVVGSSTRRTHYRHRHYLLTRNVSYQTHPHAILFFLNFTVFFFHLVPVCVFFSCSAGSAPSRHYSNTSWLRVRHEGQSPRLYATVTFDNSVAGSSPPSSTGPRAR